MAGEKIKSLQILRGVAALMVVWMHAFQTHYGEGALGTHHLAAVGSAGVDIFFVISGVVIYQTGFARKKTAGQFMRARIKRIVPAYYIVTVAWVAICLVIGRNVWPHSIQAALLFWPIWGGGFIFPILPVGWTLCFEMLFYCGAALVLLWRPSIIVIAALYVAALMFFYDLPVFRFIGSPMIIEFLFGVAIAALRPSINARLALALVLAGLALLVLPPLFLERAQSLFENEFFAFLRVLFWGVPAAMIVCGAMCLERFLVAWSRLPVAVGNKSYEIYLIHWPLLNLA